MARPARAAVPPRVELSGKIMLVTGATPGSIGFETARALAAWGASVLISTRSNTPVATDALNAVVREEDHHGSVRGRELDLTDTESVARFAEWAADAADGRLDVLVNNAGVHLDLRSRWKEPKLTADGHEIHWRTNYLGTAQLTALLLPALNGAATASGVARVVNVVSKLHTRGSNAALFEPILPYNSWTAYGVSKLALVHATFELQRRFQAEQVHAYCLHPGSVYTHIADRGLENSRVTARLRRAFGPIERRILATAAQGAQTSIHCATQPGLAGGRYFRNCAPAEPSLDAYDEDVARRLWMETDSWLGQL